MKAQESGTQAKDNKAVVTRLFDEIFSGTNPDAADDVMAGDYLEHAVAPFSAQEPGLVHGPTHAREVVQWLRAQFPDLTMTVASMIAEDDTVAARVRSEGTNTGLLGGVVPPTNKRFVAEQSRWYRVAEGKLCEHWATRDDLSAMLQLGVIEPPDQEMLCDRGRGPVLGPGLEPSGRPEPDSEMDGSRRWRFASEAATGVIGASISDPEVGLPAWVDLTGVVAGFGLGVWPLESSS